MHVTFAENPSVLENHLASAFVSGSTRRGQGPVPTPASDGGIIGFTISIRGQYSLDSLTT